MQTKTLSVAMRDAQGKGGARKLRAQNKIPGIVYEKGQQSRSVVLDRKTFELFVKAGSHHGLLDLSFETGQPVKALVREIQVHPVSREYVHVDLQRISMTEKIRIEVPIVLLGKPEGVKTQGGILEHNLRNIEVECLPSDIPHQIEIDVSNLNLGKSIHVSELSMPGVQFMAHGETTIATVSLPAAERATEETAAAATEVATPAEGEVKPGEKGEAKPGAKDAKPGAKDVKPAAKDAKPAAKDAKPAAKAGKPAEKPKGGKG